MLFNVEQDHGAELVAYLVLDDFSSNPAILVRGGGSEIEVEANETREALVTAGRHETGRCGFRLKAATTPQLLSPDLELREARSGVLIYRRRPKDAIDRKVLRLETHLLPLWRFDEAFARRFQYGMWRIERYGRETMTQMFLLSGLKSQYLAGRVLFKNFEYFMDDSWSVWICVQPPYIELAERLLLLKSVRKVGTHLLSERDEISLLAAMEFAETVSVDDPKALKRALRAMPEEVAMKLSNPLTRQLTASTPDEMPSGGALAAALDVLARCELVGFRDSFDNFMVDAARLLDMPADTAASAASVPLIRDLARTLEDSGAVESLLEKDLELYHLLAQAKAQAAAQAAAQADDAASLDAVPDHTP